MSYFVYTLGFTSIAVLLAVQISMAKVMHKYPGFLQAMPKNCSNATFCFEKHPRYPQDVIDMLLSKKYNITLARPDEAPVVRGGPDQHFDCRRITNSGKIYHVTDKNRYVRMVVQSPNKFTQQIDVEQCEHPNGRLKDEGSFYFPPRTLDMVQMTCVQETIDYKFLVLTLDGKGFEFVSSIDEIPVCCSRRIILGD